MKVGKFKNILDTTEDDWTWRSEKVAHLMHRWKCGQIAWKICGAELTVWIHVQLESQVET